MDDLIIREMKEGEQKALIKTAKRAFPFFEGLFVGTPKRAMAAEHKGKIVGGIMYKNVNAGRKNIVYISEAFVDPDYHGKGVGRRLYAETFDFIRKQGCDGMTALVKDDNAASFKLFMDNGFKRVSFFEAMRHIGPAGIIKQYFMTPLLFATGMDFYMNMEGITEKEKRGPVSQITAFFLTNILLLLPIWIKLLGGELFPYALAYIALLALFSAPRCVAALLSGEKSSIRFNNGGGLVTFLVSFGGNAFPMNINWYPEKYADSDAFRRKMAVPELIKWCIFTALPLLAFAQNGYLRAIAQLSCYFLIFMILPFYPCEALGAGRIYKYNKKIWIATAVITCMELYCLSRLTSGY